MANPSFLAYKVSNVINAKEYIGVTSRSLKERWKEHRHDSRHAERSTTILHRAMARHGAENFTIEAIASSWSEEDVLALETLLIRQENTLSPNGYNLTEGGRQAMNNSEETRRKKGWAKGIKRGPYSAEWRAAMSAAKSAPDQRAISSENGKRNKGRTRTEEAKAKMSAQRAGQELSAHHRQRISEGKMGKPNLGAMGPKTAEHKAKIGAALRNSPAFKLYHERRRKAALQNKNAA